jgi:hypothetical protein
MSTAYSVVLEDRVRDELAATAKDRGVDIPTLLRDLAEREARELLIARIRAESAEVGRRIASSPEAQEFYDFWTAPQPKG